MKKVLAKMLALWYYIKVLKRARYMVEKNFLDIFQKSVEKVTLLWYH